MLLCYMLQTILCISSHAPFKDCMRMRQNSQDKNCLVDKNATNLRPSWKLKDGEVHLYTYLKLPLYFLSTKHFFILSTFYPGIYACACNPFQAPFLGWGLVRGGLAKCCNLTWHLHQAGIPDVDHYLDDFIILGRREYLLKLQTDSWAYPYPYPSLLTKQRARQLSLGLRLIRPQPSSVSQLTSSSCENGPPRPSSSTTPVGPSFAACWTPRATPIRLNNSMVAGLAWNGSSLLHTPYHMPRASGSWGCGAWHQRSRWCGTTDRRLPKSIAEKELLPIILACATWALPSTASPADVTTRWS